MRLEGIRTVARVIAKSVAFMRWLSAPEELPSRAAEVDPRGAGADMPGFSRWLLRGDTFQQLDPTLDAPLKPPRFFRSVLSTETLSPAEPRTIASPSHPPRSWPWVFAGEELSVGEPADGDQSSRTMFFTRLLEVETCPTQPGGAIEHREGLFRRLLAPELCPSQPVQAPPAKKGFVRWVLEHEECPVNSTSAPVRRRGFWRNLFASEKL